MPPEDGKLAEAAAWLSKVTLDLRGASIDLNADPPLVEDALFHCQQAVEKCMKAFLAWNDQRFRKTHSLEELGVACEQIEPSLKEVIDPAVPLTEYAWAFRYPGDSPSPPVGEARDALETTRRLILAFLPRMPADVAPAELKQLLQAE